MLALGVALLASIDLIILTVYTLVEAFEGDLLATRISDRENPEDLIGVS